MTKCLKAKNHIVFFIHKKKKQCFSKHFDFNNQFIKVKRTLAKLSKTTKNLFCFVLISGFMNLYIKRISNIKKVFSFDNLKQLGFLPDKIRISLQRRTFLEPQIDQQIETTTRSQILSDIKAMHPTLGRVYLGC